MGEIPTVGNKPDGFEGETLVPAMGGTVPVTGSVTRGLVGLAEGLGDGLADGLTVGLAVGDVTTVSVAVLSNQVEVGAEAVAVSCTSSPAVAWACTGTVTSSSSAWLTGSVPIWQVLLLTTGQMLKVGAPMLGAVCTFAVTMTLVLAACVLHNQTMKVAAWPAVT